MGVSATTVPARPIRHGPVALSPWPERSDSGSDRISLEYAYVGLALAVKSIRASDGGVLGSFTRFFTVGSQYGLPAKTLTNCGGGESGLAAVALE